MLAVVVAQADAQKASDKKPSRLSRLTVRAPCGLFRRGQT